MSDDREHIRQQRRLERYVPVYVSYLQDFSLLHHLPPKLRDFPPSEGCPDNSLAFSDEVQFLTFL